MALEDPQGLAFPMMERSLISDAMAVVSGEPIVSPFFISFPFLIAIISIEISFISSSSLAFSSIDDFVAEATAFFTDLLEAILLYEVGSLLWFPFFFLGPFELPRGPVILLSTCHDLSSSFFTSISLTSSGYLYQRKTNTVLPVPGFGFPVISEKIAPRFVPYFFETGS